MSRVRDTQISASALAIAQESVAHAVNLGFKAVAGDAASTEALARLDRQTSEVRNDKTAQLLAQSIHAMQNRDFAKGEKLALKALERDDKLGVAWHVLGIAREKIGDFAGSMRCYEAALKLLPDHGPVAGDLGRLAYRLDMPEIAAKFFMHFLVAKPGDLEGINNLAASLRDLNRCDEAIEVLRPAINDNPEQAVLWNTLGTVMCSMGDGKTALTFFDEALRLAPDFGKAYHNRGYARLDLGDVEGALVDCDAAIARAEHAEDLATMQFGRATILLGLGRIEEGWKTYEARFSPDMVDAPRFSIEAKRWHPGMALAGKSLMICAEQGLGDEVMFANMLPDVIETLGPDGALTLAVERRLIPLFERSFPDAAVFPHKTVSFEGRVYRGAPEIEDWSGIDLWTPLGDLLEVFRPSLTSFPNRPNFLEADPARVEHWRRTLESAPPGPKVGLLWKSLKLDGERARQFSPFMLWRPVLDVPGITFVNLQYGNCAEEIALAKEQFGVDIWQPPGIDLKQDLDDVAALCRAMDLIIGFSNATTNLAGATGAPIWMLTGAAAWTRLGSPNWPWYPQTRCFITADYNDWNPTMREVGDALRDRYPNG
ncbi:tetratricopeptide repeat protein [Caulobacter soli]|uniref:tetratricopeptide repeat protein n=1 Tax=Caulobacter soli TaxID=2708539 RepID=UPI0013ED3540|nr:tetratricopeptide repeat protein [Caulobacter soli]